MTAAMPRVNKTSSHILSHQQLQVTTEIHKKKTKVEYLSVKVEGYFSKCLQNLHGDLRKSDTCCRSGMAILIPSAV